MDTSLYEYYLKTFGPQYPISHALWRIFEARALSAFTPRFPLLDLGCGDGFFLESYLGSTSIGSTETPPKEVYGIDLSAQVCELARKRGLYTRVDSGDARHMPYANSTFAFVFSNSVIEHIPDIDAVLAEVARVTQPGGYFLFSAPTNTLGNYFFWRRFGERIALKRFAMWYGGAINRTFAHHNLLSKEEWTAHLQRHGFVVEQFRYTLCTQSERTWDILLPLSYVQRWLKQTFNLSAIPVAWLNTRAARTLVNTFKTSEEQCAHGGNCIVYARRVGN